MKKARVITEILLIALLACVLCVFCVSCNGDTDEEDEPVTVYIDVLKIGKADCIIINTGSRILMIDAGEKENLTQINSYMLEKEYNKIDVLILTHYDKDHIGGAAQIISDYNVDTVIETCISSTTEEYAEYHNVMNDLGITPMKLTENYSFVSDGCQFDISIPKKRKYSTKQDNNSSLIISMKYREKSFLFCGDAMELRLEEFISDAPGHYDFIKLPYHGNYLENYREFLDAVSPVYGVITCSKKNPASADTLALLDEYGVEVYQTRYGTVSVSTDGSTVSIQQ